MRWALRRTPSDTRALSDVRAHRVAPPLSPAGTHKKENAGRCSRLPTAPRRPHSHPGSDDSKSGLARRGHQPRARIAKRRRSGVARQRNALAGLQGRNDPSGRAVLVVLVKRDEFLARDAVMIEKPRHDARVFGGDRRNFPEHFERPQGDVLQVTDRRSHYI